MLTSAEFRLPRQELFAISEAKIGFMIIKYFYQIINVRYVVSCQSGLID